MDFIVPRFIQYQLYLLQLENYELGRYWKLLIKKGPFPRKKYPQRKEIVWTAKAKALMVMSLAMYCLFVVLTGLVAIAAHQGAADLFSYLILAALIGLPLYFLWFSLALILIRPLDGIAKKRLAAQAQAKILSLQPKIKVIGIAGSYGKTTMKEVLRQVLSAKYSVVSTPESINTPVGIARWIINKVSDETQIIIVEMGEHYQNDVAEICGITKPDIAVVTGINESHLERMKNMDTVIATIFEIVSNAKQGATVVLNGNDKRVVENYKKFVWPDHKIEKYSNEEFRMKNFDTERLVWDCEINGLGQVSLNLLGEYALGDAGAAIKISKSLGMTNEEVIKGIKNIKPVEHRLQPIKSPGDILVIDDAYNGNPDGVAEAIKVLGRFTDRRKIFITPGLVEMGKSSAEIHRKIGRDLSGVADVVILIKNSVTAWIEEGIKSGGVIPSAAEESLSFSNLGGVKGSLRSPSEALRLSRDDAHRMPDIIWFASAPEAHAALKDILKPKDVILFQNDWGDQYI